MDKDLNNKVNIRPYTREWFVKNCSKEQLEKFENLGENKGTYFYKSMFEGTYEEVEQRYNSNRRYNYSQQSFVDSIGLENLFSIIDQDGDGVITKEETENFATASDDEFADREYSIINVDDFSTVYENAMASKDCQVTTNGNDEIYTYSDGTKVTLKKDFEGNILSRKEVKYLEDGTKTVSEFDYDKKTKVITSYNKDGKLQGAEVKRSDETRNKTFKMNSDKNGNVQIEQDTIGKLVKTTYNNKREVLDKTVEPHYNSDGVVDDTRQRDIGECWVLSGVNALRFTEEGSKILKDSIKHNEDGSITVTLKGIKKSYTYSAEEIVAGKYNPEKNQNFASGDDADMRVFELAFADYRRGIIPSFGSKILDKLDMPSQNDPLNGGYMAEALFVLTGVRPSIGIRQSGKDKLLEQKMNNPDSIALDVDFKKDDNEIQDGTITDGHAYSISRVTKDTVYVVNPWDSSKEISYPRDRFLKMSGYVSGVDLSKVKN